MHRVFCFYSVIKIKRLPLRERARSRSSRDSTAEIWHTLCPPRPAGLGLSGADGRGKNTKLETCGPCLSRSRKCVLFWLRGKQGVPVHLRRHFRTSSPFRGLPPSRAKEPSCEIKAFSSLIPAASHSLPTLGGTHIEYYNFVAYKWLELRRLPQILVYLFIK